jgi:predicted AlkP superfamily phosphohydrolase/phosphomutase
MLAQGKLPNLAKLMAEGAYADDVAPVYPSKTAPGFAALWTGAAPRDSGISGNRQPRAPAHQYTILDHHVSFLGAPLRAEPIWATALRHGRRAVLANVPLGRELSEGAVKMLGYDGYGGRDGVIDSRWTKTQAATLWNSVPASAKPPLEIQFSIGASAFFGLLLDDATDEREGYDTLLVAPGRDGRAAVGKLKPGAAGAQETFWVGPVEIKTAGGESASIHLRLFELNPETGEFLLYHTRPARSMIFPAELSAGVKAAAGAFIGNGANLLYQDGALGPTLPAGGDGRAEARYMETLAVAQRQIARSASWVLAAVPWDLLLLYTPFPDETEHLWRGYIDRAGDPSAPRLRALLEQAYQSSDALLGELLAKRPANTLVALVSDHGMEGIYKRVSVNRLLHQAGLLVLNQKGQPDLSRTQAYYPEVNNGYLLINSSERKGGIVTAAERARVVKRATSALMALRDHGRPVVRAVYDARAQGEKLGIGGEAGGDLYIELSAGYDFDPRLGPGEIIETATPYGNHGANPARATMRTIMALSGPGVAPGKKLGGVRLIDFAPTLATLMHLPVPRNATGRVLAEALDAHAIAGARCQRSAPPPTEGASACH